MQFKVLKITLLFFIIIVISGNLSAQGNYVEIDDIKMYYEIHGTGEPILLIHGATGAIENFKFQIPELSKKFQLIVPDCRAHGRTTDSEKPMRIEIMASDIFKLLDHLKIDSINVVGFSMGGAIGLEMVVTNPKRIRKLVAIGTNYNMDGISKKFVDNILSLTPETFWPHTIKRYKRLAPDPDHWPVYVGKFQDYLKYYTNEGTSFEDGLSKISNSVLLIAGDNDVVKLDHIIEMYRLIPESQLCIIPNAGHMSLIARPVIVNTVISKFVLGEQ